MGKRSRRAGAARRLNSDKVSPVPTARYSGTKAACVVVRTEYRISPVALNQYNTVKAGVETKLSPSPSVDPTPLTTPNGIHIQSAVLP